MRGNTAMTRRRGQGSIAGAMEIGIKDNGRLGSDMEMDFMYGKIKMRSMTYDWTLFSSKLLLFMYSTFTVHKTYLDISFTFYLLSK